MRNIDGARGGFIDMPAGTWYVWQVSGTGTCASYPIGLGAIGVPYGMQTSKAWALGSVNLEVTGIPSGRSLVVHTAPVTACSSTATTPTTTLYKSATATTTTSYMTSVSRSTANTTYYAYIWNKSASTTNKCTAIGTFVVGPLTGPTLTKPASSSTTDVKGP